MPSLFVIQDMPDVVLAEGKPATSEVQIAKTGGFRDPRYGAFNITLSNFNLWISNFNAIHLGEGRLGLPIDVDHGPEKSGNTEAAGWVKKLTIKNDSELWASVEWTPLGVELVQSKRYAYLSPSYLHDYKDEQGKSHGTALVGVGLTNRPFLTMAAVSLSAVHFGAEEVDPSYTPNEMPELTKIAQALGLSADASEDSVIAAIAEKSAVTVTPVSLADQAKAEGMVVLSADDHAKQVADATAGAAAAVQLAKMTFDTAFTKALTDGRAIPAMKDNLVTLHDVNPELALKMVDDLPKILNTVPTGAGGEPGASLSDDIVDDAKGFTTDPDRNELHSKVLAVSAEKGIDYGTALDVVLGA